DIYVFDQLLRGNIAPGVRILDAGCGYGRNLVYLLQASAEIFAVDANAHAVEHVRQLSRSFNTRLPDQTFPVCPVQKTPFPHYVRSVVLGISVLHFSGDEASSSSMLVEHCRVLRSGGLLFCRLDCRIGMDFPPLGGNLFAMPDGQKWFLVDEQRLL